ncbi:hypothetical protein Sarmat_00035 [Rickettsiales endosymbiont of Paramecium tredecaurelia]|nr:hypothetical protein [Candidatus Sarmatiella mevalonica]
MIPRCIVLLISKIFTKYNIKLKYALSISQKKL